MTLRRTAETKKPDASRLREMGFNRSEEIYGCRGEAWNGSTGAWSAADEMTVLAAELLLKPEPEKQKADDATD